MASKVRRRLHPDEAFGGMARIESSLRTLTTL
jgi:hypothetical protein